MIWYGRPILPEDQLEKIPKKGRYLLGIIPNVSNREWAWSLECVFHVVVVYVQRTYWGMAEGAWHRKRNRRMPRFRVIRYRRHMRPDHREALIHFIFFHPLSWSSLHWAFTKTGHRPEKYTLWQDNTDIRQAPDSSNCWAPVKLSQVVLFQARERTAQITRSTKHLHMIGEGTNSKQRNWY